MIRVKNTIVRVWDDGSGSNLAVVEDHDDKVYVSIDEGADNFDADEIDELIEVLVEARGRLAERLDNPS